MLHLQVQYITAEHGFRVQMHTGAFHARRALDCLSALHVLAQTHAVQLSRLRAASWRACIQTLTDKTLCDVWCDMLVPCHATIVVL